MLRSKQDQCSSRHSLAIILANILCTPTSVVTDRNSVSARFFGTSKGLGTSKAFFLFLTGAGNECAWCRRMAVTLDERKVTFSGCKLLGKHLSKIEIKNN